MVPDGGLLGKFEDTIRASGDRGRRSTRFAASGRCCATEWWLHNLFIYLEEKKSAYIVGRIITHVCEASAAYCMALAKAAKEKEHRQRHASNQRTIRRRQRNPE